MTGRASSSIWTSVRDNYMQFSRALPDTRVFYAVKANPAPELLRLLAGLGSCFDTASVAEMEMVLATGATADRISFGNTIKKERDIVRALEIGVRLFAVDCEAEVDKIVRAVAATGAEDVKVFCRILCDGAGAEWPLSRKFGCAPEMAVDVLEHAHRHGLEAYGVSFHVGSQQSNTEAWDQALASSAAIFRECTERGIRLSMVNLGGGFPTQYLKSVPAVEAYGQSIFEALSRHFGNPYPGDDHRAGSRHGRQCRRDRGGGGAGFAKEPGRGRNPLGPISISASSVASPKPWMNRSAMPSAPRTTRHRRHPASWPARPAIRPMCSMSASHMNCLFRSPLATRS